jgi:Ca-activated chloride channel homolog
MTFAWPWMLLGLALVPLLVQGYRGLVRRRSGRVAELAALGLMPASADARVGRGRWRRHVAPALFLGALTLMLFSLARPQATVAEPHREGTVILAFDSSSSMKATDLAPNRMVAAQDAARAFVRQQRDGVRIGVVAFGEGGLITQQPTLDRSLVLAAIDRMAPQGGTALGRALQTALSAIAGKTVQLDEGADPSTGGVEAQGQDLGYFGSAAVVLLSDGQNTAGPDPLQVAEVASTAGVKVYPVGIGSPQGTVVQVDGFQLATALDEPTLQEIAKTTGGRYFAAPDGKTLTEVYRSIDLAWTVRRQRTEVTALFAGGAAVLLLVGAGLSLAWYGRVV